MYTRTYIFIHIYIHSFTESYTYIERLVSFEYKGYNIYRERECRSLTSMCLILIVKYNIIMSSLPCGVFMYYCLFTCMIDDMTLVSYYSTWIIYVLFILSI